MRKRELDGSVVTFHAKQILNDKRVRERGNPGHPAVLSFNTDTEKTDDDELTAALL